MTKIAILINLPLNLNNKVISIKNFIKKKYGNQTYLNHHPHITLFTCDITSLKELKLNIEKLNKKINFKKITIKTSNLKFFKNDSLTNKNTFYLSINRNKLLKSLQKKVYDELRLDFKTKLKIEQMLNVKVLKKNYLKFGYPFFGKIWEPHITIASINKRHELSNLNSEISFNLKHRFEVKYLHLYKVIRNKNIFLEKIKINE